jgi:hypothetical protein
MTRASKKAAERFFALETAKRIGANWNLGEDRESPDFLVTEGGHRFGLEVSEVFMGPSGRDGSAMKRAESVVQRTVNSLRARFEQIANARLRVQLVGSLSANNLESVLWRTPSRSHQSDWKAVGHHFQSIFLRVHKNDRHAGHSELRASRQKRSMFFFAEVAAASTRTGGL